MSEYTHWFIPTLCFGTYIVNCRVVRTRGGFMGWLGGTHLIETECGYRGWQYSDAVMPIPEDAA